MSRTPGPWKTERLATDECFFAKGADGFYVATIHTDTSMEMQEANARLIAAAPDLLEACQAITRWMEVYSLVLQKGSFGDRAFEMAVHAITKAIYG